MFPNRQAEVHMLLIPLFLISMLVCSFWMADYMEQEEEHQPRLEQESTAAKSGSVLSARQDSSVLISDTESQLWQSFQQIEIQLREQEQVASESETETVEVQGAPHGLEANNQLQGLPKIKVEATGYTAGVESTGKGPDHPQYGITFSGVDVRRDLFSTIAADPSVFPLGTVLYIPGYGYGVVADTGSAIQGNKIDLYFETVDDVYDQWGKKDLPVYVIHKGDGQVTEAWLEELNERGKMVSKEYIDQGIDAEGDPDPE